VSNPNIWTIDKHRLLGLLFQTAAAVGHSYQRTRIANVYCYSHQAAFHDTDIDILATIVAIMSAKIVGVGVVECGLYSVCACMCALGKSDILYVSITC